MFYRCQGTVSLGTEDIKRETRGLCVSSAAPRPHIRTLATAGVLRVPPSVSVLGNSHVYKVSCSRRREREYVKYASAWILQALRLKHHALQMGGWSGYIYILMYA